MTEFEFNFHRKYAWLCRQEKIRACDLAKLQESARIVFLHYDQNSVIALKMREQIHAKRTRAEKHFRRLFESYEQLYWCRLSFRDDVLESTCEKTRHLYVTRLLKSLCVDYVANVDYGKKNGREHYHALVALRDPAVKFEWPYGFTTCRKVRMSSQKACVYSKRNLKQYLVKFVSHSVKSTAGRIFSARGVGMRDVEDLPF